MSVTHATIIQCFSVLREYGHSGDSQSHNLYSLSELEEVMLFLPQKSATKTRNIKVNEAGYEMENRELPSSCSQIYIQVFVLGCEVTSSGNQSMMF